jgi:hypothetical protein
VQGSSFGEDSPPHPAYGAGMCHHFLHRAAVAAPPVEGVIEDATPLFLGVRTADGRYRLITAGPLEPATEACLPDGRTYQQERCATAPS